ncbi:MAG: dihydropteroate synthase [Rhodospirillaceae bacterium]|nr:dihydropteroate synthase [Rhodospirillaceae bacterium]
MPEVPFLPEADETLYLRPQGLLSGVAAGAACAEGLALPLAGGPVAFSLCEVVLRRGPDQRRRRLALPALKSWLAALTEPAREQARATLARLTAPRPRFAGLELARPLIMGVVNVTPDSFSDGGDHAQPEAAIAHARALRAAGADIIDVGGESTRPGAAPVDPAEEMRRTVPVVRALAADGAVVSIDTRHAVVMAAALAAGARVVNDVTALAGDPQSLALVAGHDAAVVLMHMQGEPQTMQVEPRYLDAPLDIFDFLAARLAACVAAGIPLDRIAVDPGIGFGKTLAHNLEILADLALYHGLGVPLMLGVSRKSFIGRLARAEAPKARGPGSLAAGLAGLDRGVHILRVHDVAETAQARAVWQALAAPPPG